MRMPGDVTFLPSWPSTGWAHLGVDVCEDRGRNSGIGYDDQRNVNSFNVESAPLPTMVTQKVDRGLQLFEFLVDEGVLDVDLVLLSRGVPLRGLLIQPVIRRVDQQAVLA